MSIVHLPSIYNDHRDHARLAWDEAAPLLTQSCILQNKPWSFVWRVFALFVQRPILSPLVIKPANGKSKKIIFQFKTLQRWLHDASIKNTGDIGRKTRLLGIVRESTQTKSSTLAVPNLYLAVLNTMHSRTPTYGIVPTGPSHEVWVAFWCEKRGL